MTSLVIGAQSTFKNIWSAWSETLTKLKTNRLVQVFFVEMLKTDKFPLERI